MRHRVKKVLRLRQLRRAREMSQAALGTRVGLTKSTICEIERGTAQPSLAAARALAAEFQLPIEEILRPVEIGS